MPPQALSPNVGQAVGLDFWSLPLDVIVRAGDDPPPLIGGVDGGVTQRRLFAGAIDAVQYLGIAPLVSGEDTHPVADPPAIT